MIGMTTKEWRCPCCGATRGYLAGTEGYVQQCRLCGATLELYDREQKVALSNPVNRSVVLRRGGP